MNLATFRRKSRISVSIWLSILTVFCASNRIKADLQLSEQCTMTRNSDLICINVDSEQVLSQAFKQLENTNSGIIRRFTIENSNLKTIPLGLFDETKIDKFHLENTILPFFTPPLENDGDFSFDGIDHFSLEINGVKGIHHWPWEQIVPRTNKIKIDKSRFVALPTSFLENGHTDLQEFEIIDSSLKWLGPGALACKACTKVNLEGNLIEEIHPNVFKRKDQNKADIAKLDLSENKLTTLPEYLFENLQIKELDLKGNDIKTLKENTFSFESSEDKNNFRIHLGDTLVCDCELKWMLEFATGGRINCLPQGSTKKQKLDKFIKNSNC